MINKILINLSRFLILVLIQVLILNRVYLGGYINPYLYVLIILLFPLDTPKWLVLILGYFVGLTIDMFEDTVGMHAAACVAMAFARHYLLKILAPRDGYDIENGLTLKSVSIRWFAIYAGLLIIVHHIVLFYIEAFGFSEFFSTLGRIILSSIFTLGVVLLAHFLGSGVKGKR